MNSHPHINAFADQINDSSLETRGGVLLLGEGCSVKAGLPDSQACLETIKSTFPEAYARAKPQDLPGCLAELSLEERTTLLQEQVKHGKLNWAYLCIALLMQKGYIARVLTANPDPLILQACSLLGEFPAVYDCAATRLIRADQAVDKSVFFLNGRSLGLTPGPLNEVFEDLGASRPICVVGFPGDATGPIIQQLAQAAPYAKGLLWVQNGDAPGPEVQAILQQENAQTVEALDPDAFLILLAQQLGLPMPEILQNPFSHLGQLLDSLAPFPVPGAGEELSLTDIPLANTHRAIVQFEEAGKENDFSGHGIDGLDNPDLLR
ncbi:MAG: hypothetical protein ACE5ER_13005, partial [Nitrospinaceae bacterium]